MYGSKSVINRNVEEVNLRLWRISKNPKYEHPYIIIGDVEQTGPEREPNDISKRKLLERGKLVTSKYANYLVDVCEEM